MLILMIMCLYLSVPLHGSRPDQLWVEPAGGAPGGGGGGGDPRPAHPLPPWAGHTADLPCAVPPWEDQEHVHTARQHGTPVRAPRKHTAHKHWCVVGLLCCGSVVLGSVMLWVCCVVGLLCWIWWVLGLLCCGYFVLWVCCVVSVLLLALRQRNVQHGV